MRYLYILMISFCVGLLTCSCSTLDDGEPRRLSVLVEQEMIDIVNDFFTDCEKVLGSEKCRPAVELQGKIRPLKENTLGVCYIYDNPEYLRRIYVDDDVTDPDLFRVVLYHELMHCVLEFPHNDDELDIMNSSADIISAKNIRYYWDFYVHKSLVRGN